MLYLPVYISLECLFVCLIVLPVFVWARIATKSKRNWFSIWFARSLEDSETASAKTALLAFSDPPRLLCGIRSFLYLDTYQQIQRPVYFLCRVEFFWWTNFVTDTGVNQFITKFSLCNQNVDCWYLSKWRNDFIPCKSLARSDMVSRIVHEGRFVPLTLQEQAWIQL